MKPFVNLGLNDNFSSLTEITIIAFYCYVPPKIFR